MVTPMTDRASRAIQAPPATSAPAPRRVLAQMLVGNHRIGAATSRSRSRDGDDGQAAQQSLRTGPSA
jgi:hypothetical protein